MVTFKKRYMFNNRHVSSRKAERLKFTDFKKLYIGSSRPHELGTTKLKPILPKNGLTVVLVNTLCSPKIFRVIF